MSETKSRNYCLDLAKAIACICVVFMHCEFPGYLGILVQCVSRFSVPLFFMISGYFCYRKDGETDYRKKIRHICKMILYGTVLYSILTVMLQEVYPLTVKGLFDWIVFNEPEIIAPQMWFLFALLYDYILFSLVEKYKAYKIAYACIPLGIIIYIIMAQGMHLYGIKVTNYYYRNFLIEGFPLFSLGYLIHEKEEQIKVSDKILIGTMIVSTLLCPVERALLGRDFGVNIVTFFQVVSIFLYCLKHPDLGKGNRLAEFGATYSMYIYLFHPAIWILLKKVYKLLGLRSYPIAMYLMPIFCVLLTCFISFAFLKTKKKIEKAD